MAAKRARMAAELADDVAVRAARRRSTSKAFDASLPDGVVVYVTPLAPGTVDVALVEVKEKLAGQLYAVPPLPELTASRGADDGAPEASHCGAADTAGKAGKDGGTVTESSGVAGAGGDDEPTTRDSEELVQVAHLNSRKFSALAFATSAPLEDVMALRSIEEVYAWVMSTNDLPLDKTGPDFVRRWAMDRMSHFAPAFECWKRAFPTVSHDKPAFRASHMRVGKHAFDRNGMLPELGAVLCDTIGLPVNLTKYAIDLTALLTDSRIDLCIRLSPRDHLLTRRNRDPMGPFVTALRPNLAYLMVKLADIQLGDVVVDCMCGAGVIPLEVAIEHDSRVISIGGDVEGYLSDAVRFQNGDAKLWRQGAARVFRDQLDGPSDDAADESLYPLPRLGSDVPSSGRKCEYLSWDSVRLPCRDGCIDVMLVDLPFGFRHGSHNTVRRLYPKFAREAARVLRPGGRLVLLTACVKLVKSTIATKRELRLDHERRIDNHGRECAVFVLTRVDK